MPHDLIISPFSVQTFQQSGTGDMGSVTDRTRTAGRFWLDEDVWVLSHFRAQFGNAYSDAGATGSATLRLVVDHRKRLSDPDTSGVDEMTEYSFVYEEILKCGAGTDPGDKQAINRRIFADELRAFTLYRDDVLVFVWTNPDTGDEQRWDLEVGLTADV